jgi:hypothetical protein
MREEIERHHRSCEDREHHSIKTPDSVVVDFYKSGETVVLVTKGEKTVTITNEAQKPDPPIGESGENYYCKRDDFTRYISFEVNPAREKAGLKPLCERTAEECYRILNEFARERGLDQVE